MDQKKIGAFICKLRKEKGLTQASLAEMLSISNRTVSKWENGDGLPDVAMLLELSKALGITVDELLNAEKKELAEVKVTEIESKSTVENWLKITYIIALFVGAFGAILSFVTLAYNAWAFHILFYNHWEIMFVVVSLMAMVLSVLSFCIGVTKMEIYYTKQEILKIVDKRALRIALINSVLPYMFLLRIVSVSVLRDFTLIFALLLAIAWFITLILVRRKIYAKTN